MSGIDPSGRLAALMRTQFAEMRAKVATSSARPSKRKESAGKETPSSELPALLAERIQALAADDPDREHKAIRCFLETIFLVEFGRDLLNDPAFALMVDHVQQQMERDPTLAEPLLQAAAALLRPG